MLVWRIIAAASFVATLAGISYIAIAGSPTATVSIQVVPGTATTSSAQCGAAPGAAAQAGFTTMALCNDFTIPIPNTAGTGLPSNTGGNCYGGPECWLGCPVSQGNGVYAGSDNSPHVWYQVQADFYYNPPCSDVEPAGGTQQVTDGANGLALRIGYTLDDQQHYARNALTTISTNANAGNNLWTGYPINEYYEITFRTNSEATSPSNPSSGAPNANFDFFQWAVCAELPGTEQNCQGGVVQIDTIETWSNYGCVAAGCAFQPDTGIHNWHNGNCGSPGTCTFIWDGYSNLAAGFSFANYHKIASLVTSDGTNISVCSYVDDELIPATGDQGNPYYPCAQVPTPLAALGAFPFNGASAGQRQEPVIWNGNISWVQPNGCPSGAWCLNMPDGAVYTWIKSIKIYSCADWPQGSSGPNPNCFGAATLQAGPQGERFFQVATQ